MAQNINLTQLLQKLAGVVNKLDIATIDYSEIKYDDSNTKNEINNNVALVDQHLSTAKVDLLTQINTALDLIRLIRPGSNYYMEYQIHWGNQISNYLKDGSYGTYVGAMKRETVGYYGEQSCSFIGGYTLGIWSDSDQQRSDEITDFVDDATFAVNYPNAHVPTHVPSHNSTMGGVSTMDKANIIRFKCVDINFSFYSSSTPQWIVDNPPAQLRSLDTQGYPTDVTSETAPWRNTGHYFYLCFVDANDNIKRVKVGTHQGKRWYNSGYSYSWRWIANDGTQLQNKEMVVAVPAGWQFTGYAIM